MNSAGINLEVSGYVPLITLVLMLQSPKSNETFLSETQTLTVWPNSTILLTSSHAFLGTVTLNPKFSFSFTTFFVKRYVSVATTSKFWPSHLKFKPVKIGRDSLSDVANKVWSNKLFNSKASIANSWPLTISLNEIGGNQSLECSLLRR